MKVRERVITMRRGWIVLYADGAVICEEDMHWKNLPDKKSIIKVILKYDERFWSFDDKDHYLPPSKRDMVLIGTGGITHPITHSRTIGYYDTDSNERVVLRVDEATGKMSYETKPFGE